MSNTASNAPVAKPETAAASRQIVLKEVGAKWSKFSEQDSVRAQEQGRSRDPACGQVQPREGSG